MQFHFGGCLLFHALLLNYSVVLPPSIPGYVPRFIYIFDMCNLRKSSFRLRSQRSSKICLKLPRHADGSIAIIVTMMQLRSYWSVPCSNGVREYEVPHTRTNYAIGTRYGSPSLITNYCLSANENQVTRSDMLKYLFS